jgi:2,4-dienoyl-CoA reductase-like NADH-dependent reductase (Old Yellow Enzyme family)
LLQEEDHLHQIAGLKLRNRFALAPISTNLSDTSGYATPELLSFYEKRSIATGLIMVEAASVSSKAKIFPNQLGAHDKKYLDSLKIIAETIHKQGAVAVLQLCHGGPKALYSLNLRRPISSSEIAVLKDKPISASENELHTVVDEFAYASELAQNAGFDGIEIHGAHFYIISAFLSEITNKRRDNYGGSLQNRCRLAVEVVHKIRNIVGNDYPIFFRLNCAEGLSHGIVPTEAQKIIMILKKAGVDVIDISGVPYVVKGTQSAIHALKLAGALHKNAPDCCFVDIAHSIRSKCNIPVMVAGNIKINKAVDIIETYGIDILAFGRGLIADPLLVKKIINYDYNSITLCKRCNICHARLRSEKPILCSLW